MGRPAKRPRLQRAGNIYHANPLQHEQQRLRVFWDIGTTTISVSEALVRVTKSLPNNELFDVEIGQVHQIDFGDGKTPYISNVCAYYKEEDDEQERLYLGQEVGSLLARGAIDDPDVLSLFKLAISEVGDEGVMRARSKVRQALQRHRRENVGVVADIVQHVWALARAQISETYRFEDVWEVPIDFILGVPSTWTVIENQKILSGFEAGIMKTKPAGADLNVTYELCHEPVASVANVLQCDSGPNYYKVGSTLVVVDAGGGTVDLATWTIEKLNPPKLRQEIVGDGGYCGSVTVNEVFKQRLETALRKHSPAASKQPGLQLSKMMRRLEHGFEATKKSFKNDNPKYFVECPAIAPRRHKGLLLEAGYEIQQDVVIIQQKEMEAIFQRSVETIRKLVHCQIESYKKLHDDLAPSAILLIGCYSLNPYLYDCLNAAFSEELRVDRPKSSMACMVSDGGIYAGGWSDFITKRMPSISYGFSQDIDYDKKTHGEQ
ncbi:MAG: hypothetical protein MMC23_006141 [Stictis urceolatum]|nr:hypothetical protein [Stictis urceolata]